MSIEGKKKRIFVAIISFLCILAILFAVPFFRYNLFRVTEKTDALFPQPDKIICHSGGLEYTLSHAQTSALWEVFQNEMTYLRSFSRDDVTISADERDFYWEFRYNHRYKYEGGEEAKLEGSFRFDAIFMSVAPNGGILINPSLHKKCFEIDGVSTRMVFQSGVKIGNITAMLEQYLVADLLNDSVWSPKDTTPLVSNTFPVAPDEIVVYQGGKSKELTKTERERVFTELAACLKNASVWKFSGVGEQGYFSRTVESAVCIELRYNKRQKYVPDALKEGDSSFIIPASTYYNNQEYDALLFTWDGEGELSDGLRLAPFLDGRYDDGSMPNTKWGVDEQALTHLAAYIVKLLL